MRGILQDDYGIFAEEIEWFTAHEERFPIEISSSVKVKVIPKGENLFNLLKKGELDVLFTARIPTPFLQGEKWIRRLFSNYKELEMDYYRRTKIFPIMHTVVLRRDIYERYPWAAQSLYQAFCQAKIRR